MSDPLPPPPTQHAKPRVLFVDDEPLALESLSTILRRRFDVTTATGGSDGLKLLEAKGHFHVVISDFDMPGMNGASFLRQAQTVSPNTVRMLLTGKATFSQVMQVVNEGYIFRFLSKPCPPPTVIQAIDDAVEQHRLHSAEREVLESRVAEVSDQLLRAERLATLGTLATGAGHELANLTVVFLSLLGELREDADAGRAPTRQEIEELERVGEHLRGHSKHLLNLGRPRADRVQILDLGAVVSETLDMLRAVGKLKRLDVTMEAPDEALLIKVSRVQLEQVLVNLLVNAADALEAVSRPGKICVRLWRDGPARIGCAVEDNGTGIPATLRARIFEPYFTTKAPGKGTGLGLPVVRQIVEGYGHPLEVTSELDRGTTFTFHFTAETEGEESPGPSLALPPRPAPGGEP